MVWVFDLRRLQVGEDHCFELSLLPVLRLVLLDLCGVWDADQGRGVLALAGLDAVTRKLSARSRAKHRVAALIERFCREVLTARAAERAWEAEPRVVTLGAVQTS